jgi:nitrate reductase NapE component
MEPFFLSFIFPSPRITFKQKMKTTDKKWTTIRIIAFAILILVGVIALATGLGFFGWMERVL